MFSSLSRHKSITVQAFDNMFEMHKPKLWIFGHWHHTLYKKISDTMFVCLGELDYIDYDETKDVIENIDLIVKQIDEMRV